MHPILATTAASAAGDIIHTIADRIAKGTAKTSPLAAPAVPFSSFIEKTTAPTAASVAGRAEDLANRLRRSAEVIGAANSAGVSGPLNIQIGVTGDATLHLPDGGQKAIPLSEEMRGVARDLHHLRQPAGASPVQFAKAVTVSVP